MNDQIRNDKIKFERIKQFGEDNPLVPPNAAATAEYAGIAATITQLNTMAQNQISGAGTLDGAVDQRLVMAAELRNLMSSLAEAAKALDKTIHPDVASKMRMRGINSFADLEARANLFLNTLTPIKAEFIALGADLTVEEDLQALIDALTGAGDLKHTGLDTQIGGTAGLREVARQGRRHVARLNAILRQVYRKNPVMLARWKAVKRYQAGESTPPPPAGDGGSTPPPSGS